MPHAALDGENARFEPPSAAGSLDHNVAGSSLTYGASRVAELCRQVELLALTGGLDRLGRAWTTFDDALADAAAHLQHEFVHTTTV